jgi:mannose/fructose/N-acetylgalactosamine-specific phosphotransferase system component IIB
MDYMDNRGNYIAHTSENKGGVTLTAEEIDEFTRLADEGIKSFTQSVEEKRLSTRVEGEISG